MRIIFFGTPEPARKILEDLCKTDHTIAAVVTQPDRPKGRGQKIAFSPVKEFALAKKIPVEQPEKVKKNNDFLDIINNLSPDIIVVVAYGKILPKEILDLPKYGCVNVHASLLPRYRGAAPVQWALLKGEEGTGITIMQLDEGLDTGDILSQEKIKIGDEDNAETLLIKLFERGSSLLMSTLDKIENGSVKPLAQDEAKASYAPLITKEEGELDWKKPAVEIHNRVRAMVPWPTAHTFFRGKLLKIWKSSIQLPNLSKNYHAPGTIIEIVKEVGFLVATGAGIILVSEVQQEGKKRLGAYEFIIGHDVKIGEILPS